MKKLLSILLTLCIAFPSFVFAAETPNTTELLMLVEENTTNKEIKSISKEAGGAVENIDKLNDDTKLVKITVEEDSLEEITETLEEEEKVVFVQPNYTYHLEEETEEPAVSEVEEAVQSEEEKTVQPEEEQVNETTEVSEETLVEEEPIAEEPAQTEVIEPKETISLQGDTNRGSQWHLNDLNAEEAWANAGNNDVIIAVIDSGCQLDHPDLSENILVDKCASFVDGQQGSFTDFDNAEDDNGHGTHVCGILAATVDNEEGVSGLTNNKAKLIVIDATGSDSTFKTQDIALAIDYAVKQKAKVINLSLGGLYRDYILDNAVNSAYENGVVCITAAGNENSDSYASPSDAYGSISVMAHDKNGNKTSASNFGVNKDISAPGSSIYSTYTNSSYKYMSGTSMATPMVSGTAALLLTKNPELTPREVKNILYASGGGVFNGQGFGRVNAKKALDSLTKSSPSRINLNTSSLTLYPDEDAFLEYSILPGGAYSSSVTYKSENPSIATVENGIVKGVAPGTTKVTVSCGSLNATCNVTVKGFEYTKITLPYTNTGMLNSSDPKIHFTLNGLKHESYMDGYEFALEEGKKTSIKINTSTISPFVRILKDGKVLAQKYYTYPKNCSLAYTPKTSGTYQLQIMNYPTGEDFSEYSYTLDLSTVTHTHEYETIAKKSATCTENGWESYKKCSCGALTDLNGNTITEIPVIKASHDWGTPSYTWNDDSVTAKRTCKKDSSHSEQETVTASSNIIREATTTQTGLVRYTATFKNTAFKTQTKDVTIDKLEWGVPAYTWSGDSVTARRAVQNEIEEETVKAVQSTVKQPTCAAEGILRYTATFKNTAFKTQTKDVAIAKTAHFWNTPTYTWNGNKVTAKRTCKNGHVEEETVTATSSIKDGVAVYTAVFKNSAFQTQTKKAEQWSSASYTWSSDYSAVTSTRYNINDARETKKETVKTTKKIITNPTCKATGSAQYKGVFSDGSSTTKTVSLPAADHEWGTATYSWSGYSTVTASRTCTEGHRQTETAKTTARVTKAATTFSMGQTTYTASFKNAAFKPQSKTVTNIQKLSNLPKVKISKLKKAKKSFTVKWKKPSKKNLKKISGVQIQYSQSRNFTSGVKTINIKKTATSKKIKRLAAKRTYYVRIRTYKAGNYSAWSPVKSVKTK